MIFHSSAFSVEGAKWRASILACLLVCAPGMASAQTSVPSLSLAHALQQTLLQNPDLQAFPYQLRVNEAHALQAAITPSPSLALEVENVFARTSGNRLEKPLAESDITLALSQVIELGDKRARRLEQVRATAETLYTQYELTRLEVLAETARRYYAVLRQQQLQSWIVRRIALEREALATAQDRAGAGALSQAEVSRLRLRLIRSESLQQDLAGLLAFARLHLAAMWNSNDPVPRASGDLTSLPPVPDSNALKRVMNDAPAFQHQVTSRKLAAAELRLQQSHNRADPSVSIGVRHLAAENDEVLVFSLGIPLRQRNSNRGNIAEAQAQLALEDARQSLLGSRMAIALEQIRQTMGNEHARATRLQEQVLPLSRQLLDDIRLGYAQGQFDVMQWLDAQSELVELERELIEARYSVHLQLLELEQLTGQPLAGNDMSMLPQRNPEISP